MTTFEDLKRQWPEIRFPGFGLLPLIVLVLGFPLTNACGTLGSGMNIKEGEISAQTTPLPEPRITGPIPLEEALQGRRSIRTYSDRSVDLDAISQLLWAAQGFTDSQGHRTAPSAGALYPLEIYLVTSEGVSHYRPESHILEVLKVGDLRSDLHRAALHQDAVLEAPVILVMTAVYERTEAKYGLERSPRYVQLEAGHAAQNILLQAVALGLGAVPIGAFSDAEIQVTLNLPPDHQPLYLIPVGHLP